MKWKRFLSAIMVVCILLTTIPQTVSAEELSDASVISENQELSDPTLKRDAPEIQSEVDILLSEREIRSTANKALTFDLVRSEASRVLETANNQILSAQEICPDGDYIVFNNAHNENEASSLHLAGFDPKNVRGILVPEEDETESVPEEDEETVFLMGNETLPTWSGTYDGISASTSGNTVYLSGSVTIPQFYVHYLVGGQYIDRVHSIVVNGSLKIGPYAFSEIDSLTSITINSNVTSIGAYAFAYCTSLSSFTIPSAVTEIGEGAFYNCSSMTQISFPDAYVSVGNYAFSFCNNLAPSDQSIKLANVGAEAFYGLRFLRHIVFSPETNMICEEAFISNTSIEDVDFGGAAVAVGQFAFFECDALTDIRNEPSFTFVGEGAFKGCAAIEHVTLAPDCTAISYGAFYQCENLVSINFGGAAVSVNSHAFKDCPALVEFTGAEQVKSIGEFAFYNCTALRTVKGLSSLRELGLAAFDDCTALRNVVLPEGLEELPNHVFFGCTALETVSLPTSLRSIGDFAFTACGQLASVDIPSQVSVIGQGAFFDCDMIEAVTIPASLTRLEALVFGQCDRLTLVSGGENVTFLGERVFSFCPLLRQTAFTNRLYEIDDAAFHQCGMLESVGDVSGVRRVGKSAFYECGELSAFAAPLLEEIADAAFMNCACLEELTLTGTVREIGENAFCGCSALTMVQISAGLPELSAEAFALCTALNTVVLPDETERIGDCAFYGCFSLRDVSFPSALKSLGNGAFYECAQLQTILLPDSLEHIGYACFRSCSSLMEAVLPDSLKEVENGLFYDCTKLATVEIPSATSIGYAAFFCCSALQSVTLPAGLRQVDEYAFAYCEQLSQCDFPSSLLSLGDGAFAECRKLSSVDIPAGVTVVSNYLFYQCESLAEAVFAGNISAVGTAAFYGCEQLSSVTISAGVPLLIGDAAFTNTPNGLTLRYSALADGWTTPQWTGPDGVAYRTEAMPADRSGTCGNLSWLYDSTSGALALSGSGMMPDFESVYELPWYAFRENIRTLRIADGVVSIGARAFSDCGALCTVIMPDSLRSCGDYAFSDCESLSYVRFSTRLSSIGKYAFYRCTDLVEAALPFSLNTIGDYAFFGCSGIVSMSLPDSVSSLGEGAFYQCTGLKDVALSADMTVIGSFTFRGCDSLETLVIPEGIGSVGKFAFANCGKLSSVAILGSGIALGNNTFSGCSSLKSLYFGGAPASVAYGVFRGIPEDAAAYALNGGIFTLADESGRSIPVSIPSADAAGSMDGNALTYQYYAAPALLMISGTGAVPDMQAGAPWQSFAGEIRTIVLSSGVTSVGANAFADCDDLRQAILPYGITSIGSAAFANCANLRSIRLPAQMTAMGGNAFFNCSSLSGIELPGTLQSIPDYAFALCANLDEVRWDAGTASTIGYSAFYGCEKLSSITLPSGLTQIGAWAFARCGSLETVKGSENVVVLGDYVFYGCESLNSFAVSALVQEIPTYAFAGTGLISMELPTTVHSIGERAFWGSALESVGLGEVSTIGEAAFYGSGLKSVTLPESVISLGAYAFGNCASLTNISADNGTYRAESGVLYNRAGDTLLQYPSGKAADSFRAPNTVRHIAEGAFYGCNLKTVELPVSLQSMGDAAFAESVKLESAQISGTLDALPTAAFAMCPSLEEVHLPASVVDFGEDAFYGCAALRVVSTGESSSSSNASLMSSGQSGAAALAGNGTRLVQQSFNAAAHTITFDIIIERSLVPEDGAKLIASVYDADGKMLTVTSSEFCPGIDQPSTARIALTGGIVTSETQIRIFLLSSEYQPLMPALSFRSDYTMTSPLACVLAIDNYPALLQGYGETGSSHIAVSARMSNADFASLLSNAAAGTVGNFDLSLLVSRNGTTTEEHLTSDISLMDFDSRSGYQPNDIANSAPGYQQMVSSGRRSWMPLSYDSYRVAAKTRTLVDIDAAAMTGFRVESSASGAVLGDSSAQLLSLRATGAAGAYGTARIQQLSDTRYALLLPYGSMSSVIELEAGELARALRNSKAVSGRANATETAIREWEFSFLLSDGSSEHTLFKLLMVADESGENITSIELKQADPLITEAADMTYLSTPIEDGIEASEQDALMLASVYPAQGSTGTVTLRIGGTRMEAGADFSLTDGVHSFPAQKLYWLSHDRAYATFDLSQAPDGAYSLTLSQRGKQASLPQCFTVDASLPKGALASEINIDKSAATGKEYQGSITFTNTGYTDVAAPVIFIDTGSIELKEEGEEAWTQKTVFVRNLEGLPGLLANGETTAYNFTYKVTAENGFVVNVYNYADLSEKVAEDIVLSEASTPADFLNYNLNALVGQRAQDFAVGIAEMANSLAALGETCYDLDYLRGAYLANAQGTLMGSTMAGGTDLVSRELSISRGFCTDIQARQKEGLFGKGWYSEYDVTAEYSEDTDSVVVHSANGLSIYAKKDGVYTEALYGRATAEVSASGITLHDPDGSSVQFNGAGKLSRSADAYGNTVQCVYDAAGKLSEIQSSDGDSLILTYGEDGALASIRSALTGNTVTYEHESGYLTGFSSPFGGEAYEYDLIHMDGRRNTLTKVTSSTGIQASYSYDTYGRLTSVSNGEGTVSYAYTAPNAVEATDAAGDIARLYFNGAGQLARTVDASGVTQETSYSNLLLSEGASSGLFHKTGFTYDDSYNLTKITDPAGGSVQYGYDGKGNMTAVTDRGGMRTEYQRNTKGDVQKLLYADGRYETFEYDAKGNVTAAARRDGKRVTFAYDSASQLTRVDWPDGSFTTYAYDSAGNTTEINENGAVTRMTYTGRGELKRVEYPQTKRIDYTYDDSGNIASMTVYYNGASLCYSYVYDSYNRLAEVHLPNVLLVSYAYNPDGSLRRENKQGSYTEYGYAQGRLASIRNCRDDGTLLSSFAYHYDELGNLVSMEDAEGTWTYRYDKLGQLIRADSPDGKMTSYSYDLSGNRVAVSSGGQTTSYNANELNQYTAFGNAQRAYDANGNLISQTDSRGTTTYAYDYRERLSRVTEPDGTVTAYSYDAFGNRNAVGRKAPGAEEFTVTEYINTPTGSGSVLFARQDGLLSCYAQGIGLIARLDVEIENCQETLYNYSYNHLGSVSEITDEAGQIVNRYAYDQEGKVTSSSGNLENPYTYVGRYGIADDGNGLYYARARYVSTETMSFTQMDPIGQGSDLNLYRYAGNDPVSFVDVTGAWSINPISILKNINKSSGVALNKQIIKSQEKTAVNKELEQDIFLRQAEAEMKEQTGVPHRTMEAVRAENMSAKLCEDEFIKQELRKAEQEWLVDNSMWIGCMVIGAIATKGSVIGAVGGGVIGMLLESQFRNAAIASVPANQLAQYSKKTNLVPNTHLQNSMKNEYPVLNSNATASLESIKIAAYNAKPSDSLILAAGKQISYVDIPANTLNQALSQGNLNYLIEHYSKLDDIPVDIPSITNNIPDPVVTTSLSGRVLDPQPQSNLFSIIGGWFGNLFGRWF